MAASPSYRNVQGTLRTRDAGLFRAESESSSRANATPEHALRVLVHLHPFQLVSATAALPLSCRIQFLSSSMKYTDILDVMAASEFAGETIAHADLQCPAVPLFGAQPLQAASTLGHFRT